eukprot:ctg_138.g43
MDKASASGAGDSRF